MLTQIKASFEQQLMPDRAGSPEDEAHRPRLAIAASLLEITRADEEVSAEECAAGYYQFTSLINAHYGPEQRVHIMERLWRIAYADETLHHYEKHLVRKLAQLLDVPTAPSSRQSNPVAGIPDQVSRIAPGSSIWMGLRVLILLTLAFPLAATAGSYAAERLPNNALVIIQNHTRKRAFCTEVVSDAAATKQGLMHRTSLNADAGMLFRFDPPREVRFWMKDTLIPLDMLFIDTAGRILAIEHRTEPGSLRLIGPREPVSAVLEIKGGLSEQLGIGAGDTVRTNTATACR